MACAHRHVLAPQMGFPTNSTPKEYDRKVNKYPQFTGGDFKIDIPFLQQNVGRLILPRNLNTRSHVIIMKITIPLPMKVTPTYNNGKVITYPMLQRGFIPTLLDAQTRTTPVIVFAMQSLASLGQLNHVHQDIGIFRGLPQPAGPDSRETHVHTTLRGGKSIN